MHSILEVGSEQLQHFFFLSAVSHSFFVHLSGSTNVKAVKSLRPHLPHMSLLLPEVPSSLHQLRLHGAFLNFQVPSPLFWKHYFHRKCYKMKCHSYHKEQNSDINKEAGHLAIHKQADNDQRPGNHGTEIYDRHKCPTD